MKRTCLQKNTTCPAFAGNTNGIPMYIGTCEFHQAENLSTDQFSDPKDIQQVRSFVRMKRMKESVGKSLLVLFFAVVMSGQIIYAQTAKRGLAISTNTSSGTWYNNVKSTNSSWYYTWGTTIPESQIANMPPNADFVPMFWGASSVNASNINKLKELKDQGVIKYVLGFNEPDLSAESNMTVEQALNLWPQLESIGLPLVSPATSFPSLNENSWFVRFMDAAIAQGRRIDYIAVHLYVGSNPDYYITVLQNVWDKYQLPIWITEFAVRDDNAGGDPKRNGYTPESILPFMKNLLPRLEELPFLYRYSWFHPSPTMAGLFPNALFNLDGSLTILGGYYKSLGLSPENEDTSPIVTFNRPISNAMLSSKNVTISATAFDIDSGTNDGDGIEQVKFEILQNNTVLAEMTRENKPYTWNLDISSFNDGSYTLRATVTSTSVAGGTSSVNNRSVTINSTGTSLSNKKTSSASSFQTGNTAANGNDGNTSSRWAASSEAMPQWWMVDLGEVCDLTYVDIYWYNGASRSFKYLIEVSDDDVTYNTIADQSDNTTMNAKSTDNLNVSGRYVRVTITGSSTGWASIHEVQVFGIPLATNINTAAISNNLFNMYPNPGLNGSTTLHLKNKSEKSVAEVSDLNGKMILQRSFSDTITLNNLQRGHYFVKVSNSKGTEVRKLVIQ